MKKNQKVTVEQVIESYYRNFKKHANVARELGISRERVRQILKNYDLPTDTFYKEKQFIKDNSNKTAKELQQELGISVRHVKKLATEEKVELKKGIHPNVKHTSERLIELYNECQGNYNKIAKCLNVPQPVVSRLFKVRGLRDEYPAMGRNKSVGNAQESST